MSSRLENVSSQDQNKWRITDSGGKEKTSLSWARHRFQGMDWCWGKTSQSGKASFPRKNSTSHSQSSTHEDVRHNFQKILVLAEQQRLKPRLDSSPETVRASAVTVKNKRRGTWEMKTVNGRVSSLVWISKITWNWGTWTSPQIKHNNSQGNRRPCWDWPPG